MRERDGKLVGLRHQAHNHTCANVDISHRLVRLNVGTPTYMRAPGESSGSFGLETAMDELAVATGVDPIELRLRNYAEIAA